MPPDHNDILEVYSKQMQLCITANQIYRGIVVENKQGKKSSNSREEEEKSKDAIETSLPSTPNNSKDAMQHLLFETCTILNEEEVTKYAINPDAWLLRKESCLFFTFRFKASAKDLKTVKSKTNDDDSNLLSMFSSLSLSSKKSDPRKNDEDESNNDSILKLAAVFVVSQIIRSRDQHKQSNIHTNTDTVMNDNVAGESGITSSLLYGFSKKLLHKASNAVTSVLASYDLAEDPNQFKNYENNDLDNQDDDAFDNDFDESLHQDDECDDAKGPIIEPGENELSCRSFTNLRDEDLVWSVTLLIDCWTVIIHSIKSYISTMKDEYVDFSDHLTLLSEEKNLQNDVQGIILKRWGEDDHSFLTFCQKAGSSNSDSLPLQRNYTNAKDDICQMLLNLTMGTSLDLLLRILIESNHAILSPDEDLVILYPRSSYNIPLTTKFIVNDVDIAIFKLSSTVQSIEKRIQSLSAKSDTIKQNALSSKQNGDTKMALMHMKRRQLVVNEIDRCSTSLLNLESGLHSLKRARSDVQVLKAYEMMNETMKNIRKETSISHVEEVMDEYNENVDNLGCVQTSFGLPSTVIDEQLFYDEDELEKELLALGDSANGNNNSGSASDNGTTNKSSEIINERKEEDCNKIDSSMLEQKISCEDERKLADNKLL